MPSKMKLVLDNGMEFCGDGFGACETAVGDLVFNTSVVGYQEMLSDPSYAGKIVLMTYPVIGQYGIADEDFESKTIGASGLVVREYCDTPSNFRFTQTLSENMEERRIPGISGLDTRMLTHIIRDNGPVRAAIVPDSFSSDAVRKLLEGGRDDDMGLVRRASCTKRWFSRTPNHKFDVVVLDCGVKHSAIAALNALGCNVTVLPFDSGYDEIMSFHPDGVMISSGPGDAHRMGSIVEVIKTLRGKVPVVGTGLGFELILLGYGEKLEKLRCGEYGGAPVAQASSGRIISVHCNRSFTAGDKLSTPWLEVSYRNVCDKAVVGFECAKEKVSAVQFHPEGGPGSCESDFFEKFIKMMEDVRNA